MWNLIDDLEVDGMMLMYIVKLQSVVKIRLLLLRTFSLAPVIEAGRDRERSEVGRLTKETNALEQRATN